MAQNTPTIASILQTLSMHYNGPVTEREVMDRVLEQRPSRAKDPYAAIREKLRWQGPSLGWVRLGGGTLLPLRVVLQGLRFRCVPSAQEVRSGQIDVDRLMPFVRLPDDIHQLEDMNGTPLPLRLVPIDGDLHAFSLEMLHPRLDLRQWYEVTHFAPGDSILFTVVASQPLTLRLQREPAVEFRAASVAAQDAELIGAIWNQIRRLPSAPLHSAEVILPTFARAAWRGSYPGLPWQTLVEHDGRMRLIDGGYIGQTNMRPSHSLVRDEQERAFSANQLQQALLRDVEQLQARMQASRREDVEAGIWDGQMPRKSLAESELVEDEHQGLDMLLEEADEQAEAAGWAGDDEDEWDDLFDEQEELDLDDLDDDPDLLDASQRLLAALTPEEVERIQRASPEEVNLLIASKLNYLLVHEPSLFVTIAQPGVKGEYRGPVYNDTLATDLETQDTADEETFDDWDDDDEWLGEIVDDDENIEGVLERSEELMRQFYDFLRESGKSDQTARKRTGDLWVYAEFLARTYQRSLDGGDYGTLDECLFFFYPHTVIPRSPSCVKSLCTSVRQFYAFLKGRGAIADDSFAQAMWRRRDEAAQVVELYQRIRSDWSSADKITERLFAPYTE